MKEILVDSLFLEDIFRRIFIFNLDKDNLENILELVQNLNDDFKNDSFIDELQKAKMDENYLNEIRWEFNRLFVGPRRPKAVPYESVYFDYKTMFGNKTMEVREFYSKIGLRVKEFDKFPDDFIGYEFEYLYFMSHKALNAEKEDEFLEIIKEKNNFLISHPLQWFDKFIDLCINSSDLKIWKDFGKFIKLYLNNEADNLKEILNLSNK